MALRSLGSTLIAKTGTGSALRQKDEARMGGAVPEQAAGAQPEGQVRQNVNTPLEVAVPQGSQKVLSTQPLIQPKLDVSSASSGMPQGLLGEMGGAAKAAETGRPISTPVAGRSSSAQAGAAPVSGGTNIATKLNETFGGNLTPEQKTSYAKSVTAPTAQPTPSPVQVTNKAPSRSNPIGFLEGTLGGTVQADAPGQYDFKRNLAQGIASTLGGIIDQGGKFLNNILPEMNVSEGMQSFGNNPSNSQNYGIMSNITNAVKNAVSGGSGGSSQQQAAPKQTQSTPNPWQSPAPSYAKPQQQQTQSKPAAQPAKQNVVQQVSNWLRSLFR